VVSATSTSPAWKAESSAGLVAFDYEERDAGMMEMIRMAIDGPHPDVAGSNARDR
jgi:hypothetical protein